MKKIITIILIMILSTISYSMKCSDCGGEIGVYETTSFERIYSFITKNNYTFISLQKAYDPKFRKSNEYYIVVFCKGA